MIFSPLSQKTAVMAKHAFPRLAPRYNYCGGYIMCQFITLAQVEPRHFIFCGFSNGLIYRLFVGILILIIPPLTAISHTLSHTMEIG